MRWIFSIVMFSLIVSTPAQAGWSFRQVVRNSGSGDSGADSDSLISLDGNNGRIEFQGTSNPMFSPGSYMLFRGTEPKGLFFVDPKRKTYSKFDAEGLNQAVSSAGAAAQGSGMQMAVSDAKVEKLIEEPGPELQGVPTMHYRYRKSYTMTMDMGPMKMVTAHEILEDVWTTTAIDLGSEGFSAMVGMNGGMEAFSGIGELAKLDRDQPAGFALKRITVDHSKPQKKGVMARMMRTKEEDTTSTTEVLDLKRTDHPAAIFAIPAGYAETQMMQPAGVQAPDLEDGRPGPGR